MEFIFIYARNTWVRTIFVLGMFICALFLPWWISACMCCLGMIIFKLFFEGILWSVYIEGSYMYSEQFPVVLTIFACIFVVMHIVRSRLVFARNERYEI